MKSPVVLIVLDGWGFREGTEHNAVAEAQTPCFDGLWNSNPHTLLEASGEAVGLPDGQMGNSEVGHTTIGAGKAMYTDLVRISKAIREGTFFENPAFVSLFEHVNTHGSTLHVQGLVSSGGVHSHHEHLFAFLKAAKRAGVAKIAIHAFTDGRDVGPRSAAEYLRELESVLEEVGIGHIATISGRYYAMDRDNNWHRVAKTEEALFEAKGHQAQGKASELLERAYADNKVDELLEPHVLLDEQGNSYPISQHDGIFTFNFRSDRMRQLAKKLQERQQELDLMIVTMTQYDPTLSVEVAFPPEEIETTLAAEVAAAGFRQAHIAETEKFPHATYFLNGRREIPHDKEEHILLDSRKDVATHDEAPEMRAESIADAAIEKIKEGVEFIFINFANPDMVGHTGNKQAIVKAVETVDAQLQRVVEAVKAKGGVVLATADHGNAEVNVDVATGEKHTAHTTNPVPFIVVGSDVSLREGGGLADIAPTVLNLLELQKPAGMTGKSLIS